MLCIKDQPYFDKVQAFAQENKLLPRLQETLDYLDSYAGKDETRCELYSDFAPQSFSFVMLKRDSENKEEFKRWFNGGVIFYPGRLADSGAGAPTFSVTLNNSKEARWEVHT